MVSEDGQKEWNIVMVLESVMSKTAAVKMLMAL